MAHQAMTVLLDTIGTGYLTDFTDVRRTIWTNGNLRLDMQGMTNDGLHNLQVQINNETQDGALQNVLGRGRVSLAVVLAESLADPQLVGLALKRSFNESPNRGIGDGLIMRVRNGLIEIVDEELDDNGDVIE